MCHFFSWLIFSHRRTPLELPYHHDVHKLSTLSSLFSDDTKLRTYFVTKNFPFSLKGGAKTWFGSLSPGCIKKPIDLVNAFFRKYYPASVQHVALQRIFNYKQLQEENISETWSRLCYLLIFQAEDGIRDSPE